MEKPLMDIYLWNNTVVSTKEEESLRPIQDNAVYEVLRLEDGIPLFYEEHYERLVASAELVGRPLPYSEEAVKKQLYQLKVQNRLENGNVKFLWAETPTGTHFVLYVSPHRVVSPKEREQGCKTSLFQLERDNPNVKVQKDAYREKTERLLKERDVFELLLYDDTGAIREGNRSNLFWVEDGKVTTAPNPTVLMGITRAQVLRAIEARGYELVEAIRHLDDLREVDAVFLTSTSIDVLPIRAIDDLAYDSAKHPMVQALAHDYLELKDRYKEEFHW